MPTNFYGMLCENFDMLFIYFMPETKISDRLQWRNRLAHGTYRQYKSNAGVVSSSLTWSNACFS